MGVLYGEEREDAKTWTFSYGQKKASLPVGESKKPSSPTASAPPGSSPAQSIEAHSRQDGGAA